MRIALTGGGTAGHVNPNIALIPALERRGVEIIYIGSKNGIERKLIEPLSIKYIPISCGKLRRYLSSKNITDMARFIKGSAEAAQILKKEKVDLVFSKGGFVGLPVVIGAKMNKIPVIIHESDYSPGLANKIAIPFAKKVCVNFPETMQFIKNKAVLTGNPIRPFIFSGDRNKGLRMCGFSGDKPIIVVMGGSLGSKVINSSVLQALDGLIQKFDIVHLCGKGNVAEGANKKGYIQFEYVSDDLPHVIAAADIAVSRAGANAISELFSLKKPHLLIPLSKKASRGDQILNAASYKKLGYSLVLEEEDLTAETLEAHVNELYKDRQLYVENMSADGGTDSVSKVMEVINEFL